MQGWAVEFFGSVLHLRGPDTIPQPAVDDDGNVLLWNGEVFGGMEIPYDCCDTIVVLNRLREATASASHSVMDVFSGIQGPFAFVYFHNASGLLWYARDRVGRRSLLCHHPTDTEPWFGLTSAIVPTEGSHVEWVEVPTAGLLQCSLASRDFCEPTVIPWPVSSIHLPLPCTVDATPAYSDVELDCVSHELLRRLSHAVRKRVATIPRATDAACDEASVAVMFSGGLDSIVIAALCHYHVPPHEPIDLLNVCFDASKRSPDRISGRNGLLELIAAYPSRRWRLICVDHALDEVKSVQGRVLSLLHPSNTHMDFNIGTALWFTAEGSGTIYEPAFAAPVVGKIDPFADSICKESSMEGGCIHADPLPVPTHVVDVITAYSHRITELSTAVVVEVPPDVSHDVGKDGDDSRTPCPTVGCKMHLNKGCIYVECRRCCCRRFDALVKALSPDAEGRVCIPKRQYCSQHKPRVPPHVVVDSAPSFDAAVVDDGPITGTAPYKTFAKVLLLGIGADEQLAGYGRHRTAFRHGGWAGLQSELELDIARLWRRNLGRDDRCCSDHGKEVRLPYLDEDVSSFLNALPLPLKADLRLPKGTGDKQILRRLGVMLGLTTSVKLLKRAIQFGSLIAKQSNRRAFGSNRQGTGDAVFELDDD